jgi:hypothetical protein
LWVLPGAERANRKEQGGEGGAGRGQCRHAGDGQECRHDDDATANAEEAGENAGGETDRDEELDQHVGERCVCEWLGVDAAS